MSTSMPTAKLVDVADLNPPLASSLSDGEEVAFMPMSAVDAESVTAVDREIRHYSEVSKGYTPFLDGDVLVAKITPCFENGKIAHARLTRRYGFGSTEFHVVRPRAGQSDARYLVHFLRQDRIRRQGESRMTGSAGQRRVPENFLAELNVPVLPLPEQRRIAEILDKADALRTKRRAALVQLDTLAQSIFLDMFGDPKHPEHTIGELLNSGVLLMHKDGNHGSLYPRADDFGDKGVPFLSAKAVTDEGLIDNALVEHLREDKAEKLRIGWIQKGDVLLAHNASVGKVAFYDGRFGRALIGTSLTAFRPNSDALDSHYLAATLRASKFQRQLDKNMGQTTRNQVPITAQRSLRIVIPPVQLQRDFAAASPPSKS